MCVKVLENASRWCRSASNNNNTLYHRRLRIVYLFYFLFSFCRPKKAQLWIYSDSTGVCEIKKCTILHIFGHLERKLTNNNHNQGHSNTVFCIPYFRANLGQLYIFSVVSYIYLKHFEVFQL